MYKKESCVAMILAGGQGSRLYELTERTAKPAVSFGGKYRIIDFTLSGCVNSGIYTVGVLTQYQPLGLSEYIGNGQTWDLDRLSGGLFVLPPYKGKRGGDWYKGTANAIFQNLGFIKRYAPENVLILSGDHIYRMDYGDMLLRHSLGGADLTIAALEVPLSEAGRFGIIGTDENMRITEFEEKPEHPKGNLASMGIYVFRTDVLERYLVADNEDEFSSGDFGGDVIPAMLRDGRTLMAYPFCGYWKDVGTVQSLWEANMDLLGPTPALKMNGRDRRIYSRTKSRPPQYIGKDAKVLNSIITEGCEIYGTVENSVLSDGVVVEAGAVVQDSVIMSDTRICTGASVNFAICDSGVTVERHAVVGKIRGGGEDVTVVGAGTVVKEGTVYRSDFGADACERVADGTKSEVVFEERRCVR